MEPSVPQRSQRPMRQREPQARGGERPTRFIGTSAGFARDLVNKLRTEGRQGGRLLAANRNANPVSSRFAREREPEPKAEKAKVEPAPKQSPAEAFPHLEPAKQKAKVNLPTIDLKAQREAKRQREAEAREQEEQARKEAERLRKEEEARSIEFAKVLASEDVMDNVTLTAGLARLQDAGLQLSVKFSLHNEKLGYKVAVSDPDIPAQEISKLLTNSLGVSLVEGKIGVQEMLETLGASAVSSPTQLSIEVFNYIVKRKGYGTLTLIEVVEKSKIDRSVLMKLLGAPDDEEDWEDYLQDKGLICLSEDDPSEKLAEALDDNVPPAQILEIINDLKVISPVIAQHIGTHLIDQYCAGDGDAAAFLTKDVAALIAKIAPESESALQVGFIKLLVERWFKAHDDGSKRGLKKGYCVRILKELHTAEVINAGNMVEWKDKYDPKSTVQQNKMKQKALLDSHMVELVGGSEPVNVSEYIQKNDPSNVQDEPETESDEDEVHNDYIGGDVLNHQKSEALPDSDYGEWDD